MDADRMVRAEGARVPAQPRRAGFTQPRPGVSVSYVGFEDIYKAERSRLVRFVMSLGADQHEADDAVHEAFALAYQAWDSIREPRAWLHTVAMRQYYRADARTRETPAGDRLPDRAEQLNSGEIAEFNDLEHRVRDAVAALPVRQRQVMALMLAGFTAAQIAQQLGCGQAAVRQNQVRGRDSLARQLGIDRRQP